MRYYMIYLICFETPKNIFVTARNSNRTARLRLIFFCKISKYELMKG